MRQDSQFKDDDGAPKTLFKAIATAFVVLAALCMLAIMVACAWRVASWVLP